MRDGVSDEVKNDIVRITKECMNSGKAMDEIEDELYRQYPLEDDAYYLYMNYNNDICLTTWNEVLDMTIQYEDGTYVIY